MRSEAQGRADELVSPGARGWRGHIAWLVATLLPRATYTLTPLAGADAVPALLSLPSLPLLLHL